MTLEDYVIAANAAAEEEAATSSASELEDDSCSDSSSSSSSGGASASWGLALAGTLRRAARQGRLTCGVAAAARALEVDSCSVELCVLPPSGQGLLHLHSVLLEAHCYEHHIPVLKVDCVKKLAGLVGPSSDCVLLHHTSRSSKKSHHLPAKQGGGLCGGASSKGGKMENKLLVAARDGAHPSVLVLPVSPPP